MNVDHLIQLKPHEEVMEVVHESIVPHLRTFFLLTLWFLVPFFFLFPLLRLGTKGVILFLVLVLSASIFYWCKIYRFTHTVLIITDRRIIDLDQKGFFDRTVTETVYAQIDEVTYRIKGILPTLFRYGAIHLHLNGSAADIAFGRVTSPARIHDLINDLRHPDTTHVT